MSVVADLTSRQHAFLQPANSRTSSLLELGKRFFDPLAEDVSNTQSERQRLERQNKKRKRDEDGRPQELLRLQQIYTQGFDVEQVWQQVKRVLDATSSELQIDILATRPAVDGDDVDAIDLAPKKKTVRFQEDGDGAKDSDDMYLGDEGIDWAHEGDEAGSGGSKEEADKQSSNGDFSEEALSDEEEQTSLSEMSEDEAPQEKLVKDPNGLNDGFFSIDQFNKNTQFLENADVRGDNDDGAASDEEDIDWAADPLADGANISLGRSEKSNTDLDQDDEVVKEQDEDGPTFGDADLNAPDTDEDEEMDDMMDSGDMGDFSNTNDIMYTDFFAPPAGSRPRKSPGSRRERHKARPPINRRSSAKSATEDEATDNADSLDMERAMTSVRRDLDDVSDDEPASPALDDPDLSTPQDPNQSTHERRMSAFRREISRLERENVAAKPWSLVGETVAPARPDNALLEEDLDFERVGKPLPVITAEVNESIEALIKRRIMANDFDEVPRRRSELESLKGNVRRGMLDARGQRAELSDAKPTRGLGEEYEAEFLAKNDPNYVDPRSEALKRKHGEIEAQWASLRGQLDALCNWHYKPRPVEKSLEVRTAAPVVRMEEARPAAEAGGGASGLAPQEVWRPGEERVQGEVRTKGGTALAKEEEGREGKKRRRRREKERLRKSGVGVLKGEQGKVESGKGKKTAEKEDVVKALKKGGVKVIGKKGELQDVEGKAASTSAHGGRSGVAGYVL